MNLNYFHTAVPLVCAICLHLGYADPVLAQQEALPQGVGIYGFGYRHYEAQTHRYNSAGQLEPLGAPFTQNFNGRNLLDGAGGAELRRLADELRKFDGNSESRDSLLNSLDLGSLQANVEGSIAAQAFAFGVGLTKNLTIFASVPWVTASVKTDLSFSGANNAQIIKQRLGDLAFEELKDGLDRASAISSQQIIDSITNLGYDDPSHWEYNGLGDIETGTVLSFTKPFHRYFIGIQSLKTTLLWPTGYYDDPNVLTDTAVGRGYYVLTNQYIQTFMIRKFWFGADILYGYGVPTTVAKRVPETNESLVAADREADVSLRPGADFGYGGTVGFNPGWIKFSYRLGANRHLRDSYSGSLPGNYEQLSKDSNTYQFYQEPIIRFDTVDLYNQQRFLVPFILSLKAHMPIQAKNSLNERYYEVSMSSFFNSPLSSTTSKAAVAKKRKGKKRKSRQPERNRGTRSSRRR